MNAAQLIYPMFAMVILTASIIPRLFRARSGAVRSGQVDVEYFKIYQAGKEPESSAQLARSFTNQFEAPVLFYAGCLAAMVTGTTGLAVLILAWLYVVARTIHMVIHTGSNRLMPRIRAYFASWIILLLLWSVIVFKISFYG